jgi:sugar phosphate isomerase/epimerase
MRGSSITFEDYPLEQVIGIMSDLGFAGVEMWKRHLRKCRTPELRASFAAYAAGQGIAMGGLNVVGEDYFQPFGTHEQWEQTLQGLREDVDYALSLGTHDVLIWEGVRPPDADGRRCMDELLPRLVELFHQATAYSSAKGVRFLVEPHPFTVGMSDEFLIALCDTQPDDFFGVTFDFCHYGVGRPTDYVAAVHNLGHRIKHIHFSDSDQLSSELHFAPGDGRMDLAGVLRAFRDIGYRGSFALDLYGNPTPIAAVRRSSARVQEACEFLRLTH